MSKFSDLLASVGLAPKTLPQAKETIDSAKATLDSVDALFTAANLNLEQLLAAGPDALKAHLDSIDNTEELAEALQENEALSGKLEAVSADVSTLSSQLAALETVASTIGLTPATALAPEAIAAAFEAHISKATTLALSKTGHPPAHVPAADVVPVVKTDADIAKDYQAMKPGPERLAFYTLHEVALNRFAKSLRKPE
jgi:hypothetical protein